MPITGTSGVLINVYVEADAELAVGAELSATLSEVTFTTTSVEEVVFPDATVDVTIAEPRLNFEDPTGISDRSAANNRGTEGWYTLDGRKLEGQPKGKGLYIVNGKKVSVK